MSCGGYVAAGTTGGHPTNLCTAFRARRLSRQKLRHVWLFAIETFLAVQLACLGDLPVAQGGVTTHPSAQDPAMGSMYYNFVCRNGGLSQHSMRNLPSVQPLVKSGTFQAPPRDALWHPLNLPPRKAGGRYLSGGPHGAKLVSRRGPLHREAGTPGTKPWRGATSEKRHVKHNARSFYPRCIASSGGPPKSRRARESMQRSCASCSVKYSSISLGIVFPLMCALAGAALLLTTMHRSTYRGVQRQDLEQLHTKKPVEVNTASSAGQSTGPKVPRMNCNYFASLYQFGLNTVTKPSQETPNTLAPLSRLNWHIQINKCCFDFCCCHWVASLVTLIFCCKFMNAES
eukprot:GHVT01046067.1.p1 GENE.GHVT01046067.1~~GHVT01046067.1.p1  ORF type:complete len:344 (+),score=23.14 GHVT01046067.1:222-1253(+)